MHAIPVPYQYPRFAICIIPPYLLDRISSSHRVLFFGPHVIHGLSAITLLGLVIMYSEWTTVLAPRNAGAWSAPYQRLFSFTRSKCVFSFCFTNDTTQRFCSLLTGLALGIKEEL
jgi:hypothetical protein